MCKITMSNIILVLFYPLCCKLILAYLYRLVLSCCVSQLVEIYGSSLSVSVASFFLIIKLQIKFSLHKYKKAWRKNYKHLSNWYSQFSNWFRALTINKICSGWQHGLGLLVEHESQQNLPCSMPCKTWAQREGTHDWTNTAPWKEKKNRPLTWGAVTSLFGLLGSFHT